MTGVESLRYRLRLAETCLEAAQHAVGGGMWWLAAQQGQMAVENAAKAVCGYFGPEPRSHDVRDRLADAVAAATLEADQRTELDELSRLAARYGREAHVRFSYGDEASRRPPSEVVSEDEGRAALEAARRAVEIVRRFSERVGA